ncbi:ATP-binding protein [Gulosibacter chungangensis]|uniref:ATP-binding protein n=1 Tax=Gulosibacter chungangensis TaxID=979746 RepID=A0A7J5B9H0_9MICO|nr:DUF4143 domain-containing protein [Gulosibacter chungangensis]KAB1642238.1 ATP-binding protein [Gulosibacter chungangensis]
MTYLLRAIDSELDEFLPHAAALAIDGPKGVGKTETAARRSSVAYFLDNPEQRELLSADTTLSSLPAGTVLIDEWQRLPHVWDAVRRQVDCHAPPGRFILTGSATPMNAGGTHSGAARILSLRMRPMSLFERGVADPTVSLGSLLQQSDSKIHGTSTFSVSDYFHEIAASGFPGIRGLPERMRLGQLDSYIQRVIDRDLPELGYSVRRPVTLRRWLASYGAASSSTTSYAKILAASTAGDGAQPAKTTTIAYRDHLTQLWLLDEVEGWQPVGNELGRLGQAPKHQLADPALALRLLGIGERQLMTSRGAGMAGPLFESLATLSVRAAAQAAGARVGHLRSRNGDREIDLIVEGLDGQIVAIEVKLAAAIRDEDVRHLLWLREQLSDRVADLVVISSGTTAYRREDGVAVVPLALLGM